MSSPIIIGGNGHSGTRLFAEILLAIDVHMGIPGISYNRNSKDLNIRGLMNEWIKPYLLGQSEHANGKMMSQFRRRIRWLLPLRAGPWGFKNPRTMFLLDMYYQLYPDMSFIHVIRDGRDMCFGNPFIQSPTYWGILTESEVAKLTVEERMMRFWGEGNRRVKRFGERVLGSRYLFVRFEDICNDPETWVHRVIEFADGPVERAGDLASLVKKPKSIGRWKSFENDSVERVIDIGRDYLVEFGYLRD
jgi:hypothetical protein